VFDTRKKEDFMPNEPMDLNALQAAISSAGAQWQAGETSISSLSDAEKAVLLGVKPAPGEGTLKDIAARGEAAKASVRAQVTAIGAPASIDWRNAGGQNYITPVKDQGGCGSCVSFGAIATLEGSLRVRRGEPNFAVDLSEAHLFYCLGQASGASCGGGWHPDQAAAMLQSNGVTDETHYPYVAGSTQACAGLLAGWQDSVVKISGSQVLSGNIAAMKEWISTKGPISACFVVYNDFFSYRSGVYRHVSGDVAGGHCVSIVGYDDAGGYWICKNSWSAGWGDQGFFCIAYGECGIDTWAVHGLDVASTFWYNGKNVLGLWTNDSDRNAWVYLSDIGWRRVAYDNDNIFVDMLTQLATAKNSARPVSVYIEDGVIKQIYV
jgi:C1A family cysteine protease